LFRSREAVIRGESENLDADGAIVLNPAAPFKLHVTGLSLELATKLQRALDKGYDLIADAEQPVLTILSKADGFRCREIDDFVERTAPVFRSNIDAKLAAIPEWASLVENGDAAANRRRRLRAKVEQEVIAECGDTFRYLPALLADDDQERRLGLVEILCYTYVCAGLAAHHAAQRTELRSSIRGWTFMRMSRGCCPDCKAIPETLPRDRCPVVPQHAGCGCTVDPVF
jgi:hypothetical protein